MRNLSSTNTVTVNNVDNFGNNDHVNINTPEKNSEMYIDLLLNELYSNIINVNDINNSNKYEELFLYLIRVNNVQDCIRLLNLRKISNLNYKNKDGNTALHYSLANNLKEATYFLLFTLKVDYNILNSSDNSPLYWGVLNKSIDSIKILLLYDYNVNISGNKDYREYNINNLISNLNKINREELKLNNDAADFYKLNNLDNRSNHDDYINKNRINILQKNKFNVSILSELYNINDLDLLQLILEHPISSVLDKNQPEIDSSNVEDGGCGDVNSNESQANNSVPDNTSTNVDSGLDNKLNKANKDMNYIIHNFQFVDLTYNINNKNNLKNNNQKNTEDYKILIKEIGIDNENKILDSKDSELDSSGLIIWESSIISSFWIFDLLKLNDQNYNGFNGQQHLRLQQHYQLQLEQQEKHLASQQQQYQQQLLEQQNKLNPQQLLQEKEENDLSNNFNAAEDIDMDTCKEFIDLRLNNVLNNENGNGLKILELGSGCGLLGISVYKTLQFFNKKINKLILSDYSENTLKNLKYNLELNNLLKNDNRIELMQINWKNFTVKEEYDIIIGCDLIYDVELVKPLIDVVSKLLSKNGVFLYTYKLIRNGINEFVNELNDNGFILNVENAPKEYQRNPFFDKSQEYCLSFFPDLESDDYMLLKAVKSPDV